MRFHTLQQKLSQKHFDEMFQSIFNDEQTTLQAFSIFQLRRITLNHTPTSTLNILATYK